MPYNLKTGLSDVFPTRYAQLGGVGLCVNGFDANSFMDLRTGTYKALGLAAPGTGATAVAGAGSTAVKGQVRYRIRWKDQSTGTMSRPSADIAPATNPQGERVVIDITAVASAPSRVSHWIVERTLAGGPTFFPLNVSSSAPHGTAIATLTYNDDVADTTLENRGTLYGSRQGIPSTRYTYAFANGNTLWMLGGIVHRPLCDVTNGAAVVTSTDGDFTANMVGWDLCFDVDTDGKTYRILTFTNANSITLAENYAGGSNRDDKPVTIAGPRDRAIFCEPNEPESWGAVLLNGDLSNEIQYGDDGEALISGIGLGPAGVLLCKQNRMYYHSYRVHPGLPNPYDPDSFRDGRIVPLQSRRGVFGPNCLERADGRVYGMDDYGVWRLDPGGEPVEIGKPLQADWRGLNQARREWFHIQYDALLRVLKFYVVRSGESYPKIGYIWDLDAEKWVGTEPWLYASALCGTRLPDNNGALRHVVFSEVVSSANAYGWFSGIGNAWGVPPGSTPLKGAVSAGTATTVTVTSGAYATSGEALKGVPVTLVRAADDSEETKLITSNTATVLTVNAWTGTAPVSGDTVYVGPIPASWKSKRLDCREFDPALALRKKTFKGVWVRLAFDTSAVDVWFRAYFDGSATAYTYATALSEDGVTIVAGKAKVVLNPGSTDGQSQNIHRFFIPLEGKVANDVQLEFYSYEAGKAWQIMGPPELVFDFDQKGTRSKD